MIDGGNKKWWYQRKWCRYWSDHNSYGNDDDNGNAADIDDIVGDNDGNSDENDNIYKDWKGWDIISNNDWDGDDSDDNNDNGNNKDGDGGDNNNGHKDEYNDSTGGDDEDNNHSDGDDSTNSLELGLEIQITPMKVGVMMVYINDNEDGNNWENVQFSFKSCFASQCNDTNGRWKIRSIPAVLIEQSNRYN